MINHKKKYIFLHIPKCAGNSVIKNIDLPKQPPSHFPLSTYPQDVRCNYFKFTFVRNPWDRFVSAYFYLKNGGNGTAPQDLRSQKRINKYLSFKEFIKNDNFFEMWHFKPLSFFIDADIDFVGRVENLQEDFNMICSKIKIDSKKLFNLNTSNHKRYVEYYDQESYNIILEKYSKDIERFNYKFKD
jgi:hypothetical protein